MAKQAQKEIEIEQTPCCGLRQNFTLLFFNDEETIHQDLSSDYSTHQTAESYSLYFVSLVTMTTASHTSLAQ